MARALDTDQGLLEQARAYLPEERVRLVEEALAFATARHAGQSRRSGEPYIHHPISAAKYLVDLHLDAATLAATLLHDVVEDCGVSLDELQRRFGAEVARLVDGVTKLTRLDLLAAEETDQRLPLRTDGSQAESLRKMLVAMAEDIRVVLIKLADRLHNVQTLQHLPPAKRITVAQETLDIYAPLAHRLGMGEVKWQLEDLAFRHLQPQQYRSISRLLASRREEREAYVHQVSNALRSELAGAGISAEVTGRPKHIFSIYNKARNYAAQGKSLSDIYDLFALRVIVTSVQDCYAALGIVHSIWRPVPGQFDDYVANPKENLYQSLHTTVRAIGGVPLEIQVRTHEMHSVAEYGVASHWSYKEGTGSRNMRFDEKMTWMRQLLEWKRDLSGAEEFLESVKTDIFRDQVFVYTPKGDIKELPAASTPIDFAYRIHTDLGHRCSGAKVNGKLVSLAYELRNGDTVEILATKTARGPSLDWLNSHLGYVKTANARQRIRAWFRRQERATNVRRGRELLKKEVRRLKVSVDEEELAALLRMGSVEDLYAALGSGLVNMSQVVARLSVQEGPPEQPKETPQQSAPVGGVRVLGVGDLVTRLGLCCQPVPGEAITGYVTRLRGVTVHRADCPNIRGGDQARSIPVSWGLTRDLYPVRLGVQAWDRVGLLRDITTAVSAESVSILTTRTRVQHDGSVETALTVEVASTAQLSRLFARLEGVRSVTNVERVLSRQARAPASRSQSS